VYITVVAINNAGLHSKAYSTGINIDIVGVWSHIASILWYLGYARHKPYISYGVRGEHLEDASHMIDDTDSDQSVIEKWDPTILLETPYNIIMIL
jgi:hypothetical protein